MGTGLRPGPVKAGLFTPGPGEYNSIKANDIVSNKRAARAISMGQKLEATSFMATAVSRHKSPGPASYE